MKTWVGIALLWSAAAAANADDIVRWTDENGVVHFGHSYLAQGPASVVEVNPANSMDAPNTSQVRTKRSGPAVRIISKAGKKNKRGWVGYRPQHRGNRARIRR